jgi:uncharacterized protein YggT (Ycf19 family)
MGPFRRVIPAVGGLDFSPMLAIFVIYVLQNIVMRDVINAVSGGSLLRQLGFF